MRVKESKKGKGSSNKNIIWSQKQLLGIVKVVTSEKITHFGYCQFSSEVTLS